MILLSQVMLLIYIIQGENNDKKFSTVLKQILHNSFKKKEINEKDYIDAGGDPETSTLQTKKLKLKKIFFNIK